MKIYLKLGLLLAALFLMNEVGCAQPNTTSTVEYGIVNPVQGKTYLTFKEISTDTSINTLRSGMDYITLPPGYQFTLQNQHTVGDTLFGETQPIPDATDQRYFKAGIVQKDNTSGKYSAMTATYWIPLDRVEAQQAGFFIRIKR